MSLTCASFEVDKCYFGNIDTKCSIMEVGREMINFKIRYPKQEVIKINTSSDIDSISTCSVFEEGSSLTINGHYIFIVLATTADMPIFESLPDRCLQFDPSSSNECIKFICIKLCTRTQMFNIWQCLPSLMSQVSTMSPVLAIARFQAIANDFVQKSNRTIVPELIRNGRMDLRGCWEVGNYSNDDVIEIIRDYNNNPDMVYNVVDEGSNDDATEEPATKRIKSESQDVPRPQLNERVEPDRDILDADQMESGGDETVLDVMSQLKSSDPPHWYKVAVDIIVGQIITTTYNNQSYKVVGIDEAVNGYSAIRCNGKITTYAQYYKDRYKINIKYPQEPFLHVNPTAYGQEKLAVHVAPELCVLDLKPSAAFYIDIASGHDTDERCRRFDRTSSENVQAQEVKPCTSSLINVFELSSDDEIDNRNEDFIPVAQPSPQSVFSRLGGRISNPSPRLRPLKKRQFTMPEYLNGAESVVDIIGEIKKGYGREWNKCCNDKLAGQRVMTCYNYQVYKISKIRCDKSSNSTFHWKGREVSYVTFFKENYGITIKFPRQNLVMACPSACPKVSLFLVPELCFLFTVKKQEVNSVSEKFENASVSKTQIEVVADSDDVSITSTSPSTSSGYASNSSLNSSEMTWETTTPPPGKVSTGTKIYGPNYILLGHIECRYKEIHFLERRMFILIDQIESRHCAEVVSIEIKRSNIEWMGLPGPYPFLSFGVEHGSKSEKFATRKLFEFLSGAFGTEKVRELDLTFTRIWIQVHNTTIKPIILAPEKDPDSAAQLLRQNIIQVRRKRNRQGCQCSKIVQEFIDNKIIRF